MVLTKVDIEETNAQSFKKRIKKGGHRKMEMCYDGALVMPSNYAVMSEDEMMYVDGGWCVEKKWWGANIYLTHEERRCITTGQTIAVFVAALVSAGIEGAIIGAAATTIADYDDGYGVRIRYTGFGLASVPTGIWSLTKKQEKDIAKKNKVIF